MPRVSLRNGDARIVALAVAYHLGRPGSETNPETLMQDGAGLGPLAAAIEPGLGAAQVDVDLSAYQLHRLGEALLGMTNELKQYGMARGRSAVPGFSEAAGRLFPELAQADGEGQSAAALDLVTHVVMLHRRLGQALRQADDDIEAQRAAAEEQQRAAGQRWWKVWAR